VLLFLLSPAGQLRQIMISLALLSGMGIALWLAFPAWQSFWYRSVAWWLARAGGRLWRGARFALKWSIVVLAAAALWANLAAPPAATAPEKPPAQAAAHQEDWWRVEPRKLPYHVFFMALFSWLAYQAFRGRKRLVIEAFSGYGDEKLEKGLAAGLGPRLQSELARIADVYKVIDEMTPSAGRSVIEVTPGVLEVGDILKDASAIKLGPFNVPLNFFVGLIGSIVSGPRLTGALHKVEEDRFILTAEISGGGFSSNWRVDYSDFADEEARLPPGDAIQKLVEQLAFRVATDLVAVGSPRWRAVRCYTDGLRSYREAQRQQRSKKFKLRDAERCLIRALNDDQRFTQCHYNLGVVYRELGESGSAQSAFRRALGEDPSNFEACYALAEVLIVADKKYLEGAWFCKAGIGIKPDDARAWDLEAYACRYSREGRLAKTGSEAAQVPLPPTDPAWEDIQELSEISTALAWRSLCRQALAGKPAAVQRERATAFTCVRNLAVVLARRSRFAESRQVFRQAAWLAPHDPDLRLFEGRTLFWDGAPEDAAQAVEGIFAGGMSPVYQGLLWSVLAQLRGRSAPSEERSQKMRIAHRRFLDIAARVDGENLSELIKLGLESPDKTSPEGRS
jgi:tetratricopeptide (TPR) repeat protein